MNGQAVPLFDPQGKLHDVPAGDVNRALASGGQKALLFKAPDGKQRWVPESQKDAALQAKGILLDPATSLPDFTSNPKGEGLYTMYGRTGKGEGVGQISVPYSKVPTARSAGYTFYGGSGEQYQKDLAAEGKTPTLWERAKSTFWSSTEPLPDVPLGEVDPNRPIMSRLNRLGAAAQNVYQMPWNVLVSSERGIAGLAGLPQQAVETVKLIHQGDPQGMENLISITPPGIGKGLWDSYQNDVQQYGPVAALSNLTGNLTSLYAAGKLGQHIAEKLPTNVADLRELRQQAAEKWGAAKEKPGGVALRAGKIMTGTGSRGVGKLVRETQAENVAEAEKAATATQEYNRAVGERIQANRRAAAGEAARSQAAADVQVKGSQLMTGIQALEKRVRATANGKYEAVKAKVGDDADPRGLLMDDVRAAQKKWIRGSPEKIKEFQSILLPPKTSPALMLADQTAENMGYKSFAEAIQNPKMRNTLSRALPPEVFEEATTGVGGTLNWNDYQGFYEETGAKLAPGNLPPDIFKAVQEVHQKVGDRMAAMARRHDATPEWYDAKNYYRQFMETFHDATGPSGSASPVAQAFLARDPATAAKFFMGSAGDRGVVELSRYDPQLTQLAQEVRQSREAARVAPKGARKEAEPPPESTRFTPRTLTPEDIRARHRADLQATADLMANLGRRRVDWSLLTAGGSLVALLGEFKGMGLLELAGGGAIAAPFISEAYARFLERPGVIARLERITPADIAKVPPELRSQALQDLRPLLIGARGREAKINPQVWALTMSAATTGIAGAAQQQQRKSIKELREEAKKLAAETPATPNSQLTAP